MVEPTARIFRTGAVLRVALAGAGVFWLVCFFGLWLRGHGLVSGATVWGCLAFAFFFFALWAYHSRLRIDVDGAGVRYRSLRKSVQVAFADILRVSVVPTVSLRVYLVVTRRGIISFTSNVKGHRELFALLLERANLAERLT